MPSIKLKGSVTMVGCTILNEAGVEDAKGKLEEGIFIENQAILYYRMKDDEPTEYMDVRKFVPKNTKDDPFCCMVFFDLDGGRVTMSGLRMSGTSLPNRFTFNVYPFHKTKGAVYLISSFKLYCNLGELEYDLPRHEHFTRDRLLLIGFKNYLREKLKGTPALGYCRFNSLYPPDLFFYISKEAVSDKDLKSFIKGFIKKVGSSRKEYYNYESFIKNTQEVAKEYGLLVPRKNLTNVATECVTGGIEGREGHGVSCFLDGNYNYIAEYHTF